MPFTTDSTSANWSAKNPEKKGLITDVLIGNLFKDELDELWPLVDEQLQVQRVAEAQAHVIAS